MTVGIEEITEEALALPESQRAALADALLDSLDSNIADSGEIKTAWTAEIRTRRDDIIAGRVKTIPWEQVKTHLAADRAARHQ